MRRAAHLPGIRHEREVDLDGTFSLPDDVWANWANSGLEKEGLSIVSKLPQSSLYCLTSSRKSVNVPLRILPSTGERQGLDLIHRRRFRRAFGGLR